MPNDDGSVDIYLQRDAPAGHESNWLPAPTDNFILWSRVYMPDAAILNGEYEVPPVEWSRPAGDVQVSSPNNSVLAIGRVFVENDGDLPTAHALAKQIRLAPLDP